jgi:hypothetical protein
MLITLLEMGCSLSQKVADDETEMSIFQLKNGQMLKKVLSAWRNCRAACMSLLLASSRNPAWDKSLMRVIVQDYVWPTRKEIDLWQRTKATIIKEEKAQAVRVEKERKRIIREKKKAECDAIKAGRAGGCQHHVRKDDD